MSQHTTPTPVVTCTIYYRETFLVIRRHDKAKKFGGIWGFPGGKVEMNETALAAVRREVLEETGLELTDDLLFVDSYFYEDSLGLHFTVFAKSNKVKTEPGVEWRWLSSLEDLQALPRIPGIDFHITKSWQLLAQTGAVLSLSEADYTPQKYTN